MIRFITEHRDRFGVELISTSPRPHYEAGAALTKAGPLILDVTIGQSRSSVARDSLVGAGMGADLGCRLGNVIGDRGSEIVTAGASVV